MTSTATRVLTSPVSGEVISAASMHPAALAALADRFSAVAPTSTFIEKRHVGTPISH